MADYRETATPVRARQNRRIRPLRLLIVTVGLMAVGFFCGAVLGAVASFAQSYVAGRWHPFVLSEVIGVLGFGALFGAPIGAVLAPLLAWVFLRRAPLGRAIAEPALGTLIGSFVGLALSPNYVAPAAILGFLVAGVRLYSATRWRA